MAEPSAAFLAFWGAYRCQRRVKRAEAVDQWRRQGCEAIAPEVMSGLERFKTTSQWREGFMPEPARWLRHRRWEDEPADHDETGGW